MALHCLAQVIQRRDDGSVDFYQDYSMYEAGFGSASDEYWLGAYANGCQIHGHWRELDRGSRSFHAWFLLMSDAGAL